MPYYSLPRQLSLLFEAHIAHSSITPYNGHMKINVKHVAKLANLPLKLHEEEKFEKQLSSILDYFKKLNEVDTKNVEETSQVTGLQNVFRHDVTAPSLSQDDALKNVKSKHNGFVNVNAILEE